jgi:hypothetical protein
MRSTQRLPLPLWVPWLRLRHTTAKRNSRTEQLLVGLTPFLSIFYARPDHFRQKEADNVQNSEQADRKSKSPNPMPATSRKTRLDGHKKGQSLLRGPACLDF